MTRPNYFLILIFSIYFLSISTPSLSSSRPKALVFPIVKVKDESTLTSQRLIQISQRTPLVHVSLSLHLGGENLWVNCDPPFTSSSYIPILCRSASCNIARHSGCGNCFNTKPIPGCNNNTCYLFLDNPFWERSTIAELAGDVVSLRSTDGLNPGPPVAARKVLFLCGSEPLLQRLAKGVSGVVGFGWTKLSLPSQLAAAFSFRRRFAICLSSSHKSKGVGFFGDGPYFFHPNKIDMSRDLTYTRLIRNPVSTAGLSFPGDDSADYFIGVKSIAVDGKTLKGVNSSLFSIDGDGFGGTKISTADPYTVLEASIYNAVVDAFVGSIGDAARVKGTYPLTVCLAGAGPAAAAPRVDFLLHDGGVWRVFWSNSMIKVNDDDVYCLGFVDGGERARTSIVIGAHMIENQLLQFDLAYSRLGFSSSLLSKKTSCSNFNFTSVA